MDKEDNHFEDQIDEYDDLLDISLDELSTDEIDEPVDEEPDEDIIELLDLVENGDSDLLGLDEDTDGLGEDDLSTEEPGELSDGGTGTLSVSDLEMDDVMLDNDMSVPDDDSVSAVDDDLDQLLEDDSPDDSGIKAEETDITDDALEKLLDETELEGLADDTGFEFDDMEDLDLQLEDLSIEDSTPDQGGLLDDEIHDEPSPDDDHGDLFEGIGSEEITEENISESDDAILDELDNELEKAIVSSDDDSGEELLWESDLQMEASDNKEDQFETSDVNFDEIADIPLGDESLDELSTESDFQEEIVESDLDSGGMPESITDDQVDTIDESSDTTIDDALEELEAQDNLFSGEIQDSAHVEEIVISDDFMGDTTEEISPDEEELPETSGEDLGDDVEVQVPVEPDIAEVSHVEATQTGGDTPVTIPQVPLVSEEKIEEIVRGVVGEVVERIAREVFTEVAEKVITEAIDSLKKSLESDSE